MSGKANASTKGATEYAKEAWQGILCAGSTLILIWPICGSTVKHWTRRGFNHLELRTIKTAFEDLKLRLIIVWFGNALRIVRSLNQWRFRNPGVIIWSCGSEVLHPQMMCHKAVCTELGKPGWYLWLNVRNPVFTVILKVLFLVFTQWQQRFSERLFQKYMIIRYKEQFEDPCLV